MNHHSAKRVAKVKLTLTKRTVEVLEPADKPWIAWDDKLVGFGCRVRPSGTKSFVINYRTGEGGRSAPNKRVVVGRYGRVIPTRRGAAPRNCSGASLAAKIPPANAPMRVYCPH